jgi:hypothetical protein
MNGSAQQSFGGGTTKPFYTVGRVHETIEIEAGILANFVENVRNFRAAISLFA